MRLTRKLAWTVTPLVALSLGIGGFAAAAWHTANNGVQVAGTMAQLQPVTMTATLASPIWPGKALSLKATFVNPNPVAVRIDSIDANSVTYVVGAHWSDALGQQVGDITVTAGAWPAAAIQFPAPKVFDVGTAGMIQPGTHTMTIAGPVLSVEFGSALAQGSTITFEYNVSESAF